MRIYVGNLGFEVADADLEALFAVHGQVESARVISDRETGRSRGFGFVEMASQTEAEAAIQALSGTPHQGRDLTVNEARPRQQRW